MGDLETAPRAATPVPVRSPDRALPQQTNKQLFISIRNFRLENLKNSLKE